MILTVSIHVLSFVHEPTISCIHALSDHNRPTKETPFKCRSYGSLYVTLCFVLCPFDFGVLTIHFCMLSSLFVYNVVHLKRRNSRVRAKMENIRGKKDESISILIHPS